MSTDETQDDALLNRLDWKSHEILQALADCGGEATTTEIRKQSPIEENDHITHRYQRAAVALEPHGLIEVQEPEPSARRRNLPLTVTLTEKGAALAEQLSDRGKETERYTLEERLEAVEATLTTLEETLDEQETVAEQASDDTVTDFGERLETVEQRLDQLEQRLHPEFGAWSTEKQHEHKAVVGGTRAVRDFLLDEHGEQFKTYITNELG